MVAHKVDVWSLCVVWDKVSLMIWNALLSLVIVASKPSDAAVNRL